MLPSNTVNFRPQSQRTTNLRWVWPLGAVEWLVSRITRNRPNRWPTSIS